jgi:hypothetical protein
MWLRGRRKGGSDTPIPHPPSVCRGDRGEPDRPAALVFDAEASGQVAASAAHSWRAWPIPCTLGRRRRAAALRHGRARRSGRPARRPHSPLRRPLAPETATGLVIAARVVRPLRRGDVGHSVAQGPVQLGAPRDREHRLIPLSHQTAPATHCCNCHFRLDPRKLPTNNESEFRSPGTSCEGHSADPYRFRGQEGPAAGLSNA